MKCHSQLRPQVYKTVKRAVYYRNRPDAEVCGGDLSLSFDTEYGGGVTFELKCSRCQEGTLPDRENVFDWAQRKLKALLEDSE